MTAMKEQPSARQIYGTIGPACADVETLEAMFRAGMTGIRLNLSHVTLAQAADQVDALHKAAQRCGKQAELLIDMQGPELRVGVLAEPMTLHEGEKVELGGKGIPLPEIAIPALLPGQEVLLDDGKLLLRVTEQTETGAVAEVLRGGVLRGRKSLALPGADLEPPTMTASDVENIRVAASCGVTGVMQPFVRSRRDLETVRQALDENGGANIRLFAKIENQMGLERLPEFLETADEIVIARGDLGNAPVGAAGGPEADRGPVPQGGEAIHGGDADAGVHGAESGAHPGGGQRYFQRCGRRRCCGDGHRGNGGGKVAGGGHPVSQQYGPSRRAISARGIKSAPNLFAGRFGAVFLLFGGFCQQGLSFGGF